MPSKEDQVKQLYHNLTVYPPISDAVIQKMEGIRYEAKMLGQAIIEVVPQSREQSLALTALEECAMWAIAGLARNQ